MKTDVGGRCDHRPMPEASDVFDDLAADYAGCPGVAVGRVWHHDGLKVDGKIFAMVVRERLVIKVPAPDAAALVEAGDGVAFEPRPGRKMREWVVLEAVDAEVWRPLVAAAYRYVGQRV
jgi:hypothetical protein